MRAGSKEGDGGFAESREREAGDSDDDSADAVTRHARFLGIDPQKDARYLWIAEEALNADVPEGWVTGQGEGEYDGLVYYYHEATGQSTWDHPLDEHYRELFERKKAKARERRRRDTGHTKSGGSRSSKRSAAKSGGDAREDVRNPSDRRGKDDREPSQKKSSSRSSGRSKRRESNLHGRHEDTHQDDGPKDGEYRRARRDGSRQRRVDRGRGRSTSERESGSEKKTSRLGSNSPRRSSSGLENGHANTSTEGQGKAVRKAKKGASSGTSRMALASPRQVSSRETKHGTSHQRPETGSSSLESCASEVDRSRRRTRKHRQKSSTRSCVPSASSSEERGASISPSDARRRFESRHVRERKHVVREDTNEGGDRGAARRAITAGQSAQDRVTNERSLGDSLDDGDRSRAHRVEVRAGGAESQRLIVRSLSDENAVAKDSLATPRNKEADVEAARRENGTNPEETAIEGALDNDGCAVELTTNTGGHASEYPREWYEGASAARRSEHQPYKEDQANEISHDLSRARTPDNVIEKRELDDLQEVAFEDELRNMEDSEESPTTPIRFGNAVADVADAPSESEVLRHGEAILVRPNSPPSLAAQSAKANTEAKTGLAIARRHDVNDRDGMRSDSSGGGFATARKQDAHVRDRRKTRSAPGPSEVVHVVSEAAPVRSADGSSTKTRAKIVSNLDEDGDSRCSSLVVQDASRRIDRADQDGEDWQSHTVSSTTALTPARELNDWPTVQEKSPVRRGGGEKVPLPRHVADDNSDMEGTPHKEGGDSTSRGGARHADERGTGDYRVSREGHRRRKREMRNDNSDHEAREHRSLMVSSPDDKTDEELAGQSRSRTSRWGHSDPEDKCLSHGHGDRSRNGTEQGRRGEVRPWDAELGDDPILQTSGQQERELASRMKRNFKATLSNLEHDLALVKTRENNLRAEVADSVKREDATRKQHARRLDEEQERSTQLEKKLAGAMTEAAQVTVRIAEAERKAGVDASAQEASLWQMKITDAEKAWKKTEATLHGQLKLQKDRVEALEETLAKKEAESTGSDVARLKQRLAGAEAELTSQAKVLSETQDRCAEATAKMAQSLAEVHDCRSLAEKARLELAEASARDATSGTALARAVHEASLLNGELLSVREEMRKHKGKGARLEEETRRLQDKLDITNNALKAAEDGFQRERASFESATQRARARATELESANASMDREMQNCQQDALARLREVERERDASTYEARRCAERAAAAEAWRQKEFERAQTAETQGAKGSAEVIKLRAEVTKLQAAAEIEMAPHMRRQAELQEQVRQATEKAAAGAAEVDRLKESHAAALASLKAEVTNNLPRVAERAVAEAETHWRQISKEQIATVQEERDRSLREMQAVVTEAEAKRDADLGVVRVEAERFRALAEKLVNENRSIRAALQRDITAQAAAAPSSKRSDRSPAGPLSDKPPRASRIEDSRRDAAWESDLHTQMLGQVEAHINSLRGLLTPPPRQDCPGADCAAVTRHSNSPCRLPMVGARDSVSAVVDEMSAPVTARGRPSPPDATVKNEASWTQEEDMRLNRLLREAASSPRKGSGPKKSGSSRSDDLGGASQSGALEGHAGRSFGESDYISSTDSSSSLSRKLFPSPERRDAKRHQGSGGESRRDDDDKLEDISDGGFHSGCWRRKYANGDMR